MSRLPYLPRPVARLVAKLLQRSIQRSWMPVKAQRAWFAVAAIAARKPRRISRTKGELGGVPATRFEPETADATRAVLYLHGGMHVIGSARTHGSLAAWIAEAAGAPVHLLEYRLAPEHPYPAALDDTLAGYRALVASGLPPERIVVAGDSSGASLAVGLAVRLRGQNEPQPAGLLLVNGMLDATLSGESAGANAARDAGMRRSWALAAIDDYRGGRDPASAEISPLRADLHGLAPMHLQVGSDDIARGDSEGLLERARAAGVEVSSTRFEGMWHDFQLFAGQLREADRAVEDMGAALRRFRQAGTRANRLPAA